MAAANGVAEVWVGQGGLLSTPAVSAILRTRDQGKAAGAFILTASHNPGGPTEDFGIKYNCGGGEPAPESLTNAIFEKTKTISQYYIADPAGLKIDTASLGSHDFYVQHAPIPAAGGGSHGGFRARVIDSVEDYVRLLKTIFDFGALKRLLARPDFSFIFDGMHGVAGPYARRVFVDELGAHPDCLVRCDPRPDFGGGHPDPNLTYAADLVAAMGLSPAGSGGDGHGDASHPPPVVSANPPAFGAACDGDADRNMILGRRFFVTPSDSVAILAAHAQAAIPYFKVMGLSGVARSMPTSAALDRVAAALKVPCAEVPTGWKFFGNLMDAGKCSICGEESFGTGSDHVREKDGLWAVLAWLSVLAHANHADGAGAAVQSALGRLGAAVHAATHGGGEGGGGGTATLTRPADAPAASTSTSTLVGVEDIVRAHWATYGRNYYTRYDYEGVESEKADAVMATLRAKIGEVTQVRSFVVASADEFCYTDPVDGSVSSNQGIRFLFTDGSRCVYRLSGTGSSGATIRVYVEQYVPPDAGADALGKDAAEALAPLVKVALGLADIEKLTGRAAPTVIT
jgi:phosphoglucomutase